MEEEEVEEVAGEDEEDAEVMAVVAVEVSGGSFYKKSGRERGPFRRRDRRRRRGQGENEEEEEEDGGGEQTVARGVVVHGRRERADDLGDDTTKNQMHGHWLFSIRIIGFPGRRSSESPRPSRYPFSLFVSLLRSLLLGIVCPRLPCLRRRRHRCRLLRRASLAAAAAAAAAAPLLGGMGAGEKGRKNFEKKIQFRCHGDRRALTLIKIPRTSHLRRCRRRRRRCCRPPLVLLHRLVLRPLRSPLLPPPALPATEYDAVAFAVSPIV